MDVCDQSARAHGVGHVHRYAPAHVEDLLLRSGINPLARGCGYWAWKPAVILETMNRLARVDAAFGLSAINYVAYADAGVEFINNVSHIIDRMDQDIFLFGNNWEHAHWCKRDVVEAIWPQPRLTNEERIAKILEIEQTTWGGDVIEAVDSILSGEVSEPVLHDILWNQFGKQAQASVIFFRVSDYSRAFVAEWLKWCLFDGGRLIDDSPSRAPNHPEFREHRHDQAILTTMAYREGIKLHWWPAVYNKGGSPEFVYEKLPEYAGDDYPVLFSHHRKRNHEWSNAA